MSLFVKKFGGTSVKSVERMQAACDIIINDYKKGHKVVVVSSAMSGETNRLLELAHSITSTPNARELDALLASGEQVSIALISILLHNQGFKAKSFLASQIKILTDSSHGRRRPGSHITGKFA